MTEQPLRILTIEDSEPDCVLIERHLHRQGMAVAMHRVGDSAGLAAALAGGSWDLVLADYRVPGMVFEETLALLARCLPDVPVLLISGGLGEERAVELLKLGVWDFILKDNLVRLVPGIERGLREARERLALREQQAQLASIVASVPGLICSYRLRPDGSSCMPYCSPAVADLYGLGAAELARDTAPLYARIQPDDAERVAARIGHCGKAMKPWHDEFRYLHPSKGERWLEGWSVPRREPDGGILWHGYVHDITERKTADKALRDSQERLLAMIENANGIAWVKDLQGRFVLVNRYAERALGIPRERILGRRVFDLFPDDLAQDYAANDRQVLETGEPQDTEELARLEDGDHWFLARKFPLRDSEGQIYALGALCLDITERKRIETELAGHRDRLEDLVSRHTAQARRQAQVKSELLAQMGQAIRAPLDALLDLARSGRREGPGPRTHECFSRILDAGELLLAIVDDALAAFAGLPESESEPLAAALEARGARVERRSAAGVFQTPADLAVPDPEIRPREAPRAAAMKAPGQAAEDAPGLIDWGRLAARYPGKPEFVDKLAALVLTSQGEQPASLRAQAQCGDYVQLAAIAHAVKGSAGNLFADTVQDLAARAERAARGGAPESRMLAEGLAQALEAMLAEIRARLALR
jgi:PAS domain S-box-containing protein